MMRLFRRIEDRHGVDDVDYQPPPDPVDVEVEESEEDKEQDVISPVGVAIAVVGGALLALAAFLPLDEPSGPLVRVQSNTLIQHEGWWLILAGALIALTAVTNKRRAWWVCVLALIAGGLIVHFATDKSLRTLYPINLNGEPQENATGTVVALGVAVYVAGAGAALAFVGGWIMQSTRELRTTAAERPTRQCPDCAETILADAHVCKHCGYRFDAASGVSR